MKITGETGDSFCGLMGVEGEEEEGEGREEEESSQVDGVDEDARARASYAV